MRAPGRTAGATVWVAFVALVTMGSLGAAVPSAASSPKTVRAHIVSIRTARAQGVHETHSGHSRMIWVTIRVHDNPSDGVNCTVVLRHDGKVIGTSGLRGPLPGGGVSIAVGVTDLRSPTREMQGAVRCTALPEPDHESGTTLPVGL
jgi:hypothetical protein